MRTALAAAIMVVVSPHNGDAGRGRAATTPQANSTLTAIAGLSVGHHTLADRPTGCTVVLIEGAGAIAAVSVRGGAPGTRETDALAPDNTVQQINGIALAGGSAFGLDAATGVMRFLEEKKIGFQTSAGPVPIVPAAILYDLSVGNRPDIRPGADCGYQASRSATSEPVVEGSVGAGAGATVGKLAGYDRAMKGGVGSAALRLDSGLVVAALVVVNAAGTVIDPRTGRPVAGVRTADGRSLEDPFALIRRGVAPSGPAREATTLGVIATNARLTRVEALRVAEMAHDGLARTIVPTHTPNDGDTMFVLATGALSTPVNLTAAGALAGEAVSDAILRAVRTARGLPGFPAAADIR